jgi:hypothetical protein
MKRLCVLFALIMATVPTLNAREADGSFSHVRLSGAAFDVIPACRLPLGVASYADQKDMPATLRAAVKQQLGDLVPPTSPFDSTDVVTTGHNRRLIFIWARGSRWVVATEHGGSGYNDPIFAYEIGPNGQRAKLIAERTAYPDSVCLTAEELLNARATNAPDEHK